jgi:hypothetical protein
MRSKIVFIRFARPAILLLLAAALVASAPAQPPAQTTPAQNSSQRAPGLQPPSERDRLNALAHKLLAAAIQANSLDSSELKPWHIKIEFGLLSNFGPIDQRDPTTNGGRRRGGGAPTSEVTAILLHGAEEEWHAARYHWSRTYSSLTETWNGSEWRVSRADRYEARPKHQIFASNVLRQFVSQPVLYPLDQAAALPPNAMLTMSRLDAGQGQNFNCVIIADPESLGTVASSEWLMTTLCFDTDLRLRLISSKYMAVEFDNFQPFQGHAIARTIRVREHDQVESEMKVTLLETFDPSANPAVLKPSADAALQPYTIEPGDPPLEPVHEQGIIIPLMPDNTPFRGVLMVAAIVRRDGSVRVIPSPAGPMQAITDAVSLAVSKWKYKPYLIDGRPVEVRTTIPYVIDGKPFVPSYERAGHAQGTDTPQKRD